MKEIEDLRTRAAGKLTIVRRLVRCQIALSIALIFFGELTSLSLAISARAENGSSFEGGDATIRRVNAQQYRQIIKDVFGPEIKVDGRFEPDIRQDSLLSVGARHVSVTATGLQQYDAMANAIAAQVVSEANRPVLMPCKPALETEPDNACARQFLKNAGLLLYRRPLTPDELQTQVVVAADAAKSKKNFYAGLGISLANVLDSPPFLFRDESSEPDPVHPGQYRLDSFSKATRLSFLFWDAAPDRQLLTAAENGELNTEKGLARQVDRLLASPRLEAGVRTFFSDMLGFDEFTTLSKDATIYPKFTAAAAQNAEEQTLRTIVDHLLTRGGDYRELFTTRKTFLTRLLGSIYGVPASNNSPIGAPDSWVPYEYPEGDPRAGILMQASFVSLHSHPGRSSPTLRGKALREIILCQKVPDPPGNVNFTVVQDTANAQYKTARERLTAHRTDPICAGCHKLTDPMGLAMENFDSAGGFRTTENGAPIDSSGEFDGQKFSNASGLAKAVHDNPAASSCLVNRLYSFAVGRPIAKEEAAFVKDLEKGFAADGYKFPALLRRIATNETFYRVSAPQAAAAGAPAPLFAGDPTTSQESRK